MQLLLVQNNQNAKLLNQFFIILKKKKVKSFCFNFNSFETLSKNQEIIRKKADDSASEVGRKKSVPVCCSLYRKTATSLLCRRAAQQAVIRKRPKSEHGGIFSVLFYIGSKDSTGMRPEAAEVPILMKKVLTLYFTVFSARKTNHFTQTD